MNAERGRRFGAAVALAATLFASGCATASPPPSPPPAGATAPAAREPLHIVVLGDSLAMGTGAGDPRRAFAFLLYLRALASHPAADVTNFAIGGANVADVTRLEIPRLRHVHAGVVLLCAGGNDVVERTSAAAFARSAHALMTGIARADPGAAVVIVGMPDVAISPLFADRRAQTETLVRRDAGILRAAAVGAGAAYVDLAVPSAEARRDPARFLSGDEFHPSDAGHAAIAAAVWPAFAAAIARRGMTAYATEAPARR